MDKREMQKRDPIKAQVEVSDADRGVDMSPMSPPDAYDPPSKVSLDRENLHPFFKDLMKEHDEIKVEISQFKKALDVVKASRKLTQEVFIQFERFLKYFHQEFVPHNKKEEGHFFSLLNERLLASGEHSAGSELFTGIKVLEDDHVHAIRLGANLSQLLHLYYLIDHVDSKRIILQQFLKQSDELTELLELHIFREDEIIFGQAQKLLTEDELEHIYKGLN